jgi:eukaryotic-like serine/threonine-protein kinase
MSTPSDRTRAVPSGEGHGSGGPGGGERRPSARPGPESLVGAVVGGRYHVERLIGEGGMGAVYQAQHAHMHKRFAVKVLHPEMGRLPEVVARFEREAMAAARIDHPNVAAATDFGKLDDGSFFLVLEYVEGQSLRDAIAQGRLDLARALHIVRQIASALARAHALGIVHRDLKPENIMLVERDTDSDFVKVLDFGIAKVPVGEFVGDRPGAGSALTQVGMVYGTPEYMAPEQALGQPVDARADLYALGVMAFEMITGARPYSHESKVTLLGMHVTAPIPRMLERAPDANIPAEIDVIVTRLLAKDAAARFADARGLIEAIDAAGAGLSARAPAATGPHRPPSVRQAGPGADAASALSIALGPTRLAERTPGPAVPRLVSLVGASLRSAIESAPPWAKSRRVAVVAVGLGAFVLLLVAVSPSRRGGPLPVESSAGDRGGGGERPPNARDVKSDAVVGAAQATIDRGDFATAIDALTAVERKGPDRSDVHMLLERAYTGVRNPREAMREAGLWLTADPNAAADLKLEEDVRNAALNKDTQDEAFSLLEARMGPRGIDILYDIAFGTSGRFYPQAAVRARHSLDLGDLRGRASPSLAVLLDFRDAKTCDERHALLERVRTLGDARLLSALQPYESTRGCGFLGRSDCYPCMHRDKQLTEARSAIEDRAARGGGQ